MTEIVKHPTDKQKLIARTTIPERTVEQTMKLRDVKQKLAHIQQMKTNLEAEILELEFVISEAEKAGVEDGSEVVPE